MNRSYAFCLAAALLAGHAAICPAEESRTVYYQVTYADGASRELSAVPATDKDIKRVLRITRIEQGNRGYEILSTGPQPLTLVNRGQTYQADLTWNGKAWVAPGEEPAAPAITLQPVSATSQENLPQAKTALLELAQKLLAADQAIHDAEKSLLSAAKPAEAAAEALAKARRELQSAAAAAIAAGKMLSPAQPRQELPVPSGTVSPASAAPGDANGIATPTDRTAALPHHVQVWKLAAGADGQRVVHVSMAHPEAGAMSAFHYVAYADTDGDGKPDKLIARSPQAAADKPGAWTEWSFPTAEKAVFVGKAWSRPETSHYHVESVKLEGNARRQWRGLSEDAYVGEDMWDLPNRIVSGLLGNVHVWVDQGDGDGHGRGGRRSHPRPN